VGPSGCGKTTLLNIISGYENPDEGSVCRRGKLSMIYQKDGLFPWYTVSENIELSLRHITKSEQRKKQTLSAIRLIGLEGFENHYPHQLSGGMRQRISIAIALSKEPDLLLADEPTGALDFNTTNDILNLLVQLNDDLQQTMIIVTHDAYVATYADRVLFFHDGSIVDEYKNKKDGFDLEDILEKFKNVARGEQ